MSSRYRRDRSPPRKRNHQKGISVRDEFQTKAYELLSVPSKFRNYDEPSDYPQASGGFQGPNDLSYEDVRSYPQPLMDFKDDRKREGSRGHRRKSRSRSRHSRTRSRSRGRDKKSRFEPPVRFLPESKFNRHRSPDVIEQDFSRKENEDKYRMSNNRFSPPKVRLDNTIYDSRSNFIDSGNSTGIHNNEQSFMQDQFISGDIGLTPSKTSLSFAEIQEHPQSDRFSQNYVSSEPEFISETLPGISTSFNDALVSENENPLIPEFNPDTTKLSSKRWIDLIEDTSKKLGWKLDEKQYIMTSRLAGYASQWYLSSGINYKSWDLLVRGFLAAFPSKKEYYTLLKNMLERTKNKAESISDYFHHKVALLNACEIYGSKAVSCIIGGLTNEKLIQDAIQQNFADPDSLYLYLRPTDLGTSQLITPPTRFPTVKNKERERKCFSCGVKGHIKAQCTVKPKSNSTDLQSLDDNLSVLSPERITEVKILDTTLRAYIDRSSDCTIIRENLALSLNVSIKKQFKSIRGFNNVTIPSYGYFETPISVDRAAATTKIFVVRSNAVPLPVIIGKSFLEQRHIYVMNSEEKMRVYQKMDNGAINFDF